MKYPRLSVVMCVYNGARFLRQAIDSILTQTYGDFELIVIDDQSTDDSASILESYTDRRLRVLTNVTNVGPYKAANKGIAVAKGEFIARHDADDLSNIERFRKQVSFLEAHPDVGLVASNYRMIDKDGCVLEHVDLPTDPAELKSRLALGNIFCHGTAMIRREVLARIGGYREHFRLSQDYDMFVRVSEVANLGSLPEPLYHFRFHPHSLSRNKRALQLACRQLAWDLALQRRLTGTEGPIPQDVIKLYPPDPRKLFLDARGSCYLYFAAGDIDNATAALHRARAYIEHSAALPSWEDWIFSRALTLAALRSDTHAGAGLIAWFGEHGADLLSVSPSALIGRYYAHEAFVAHSQGSDVAGRFWTSVTFDPRLLGNRGLWRISLSSLLARLKRAVPHCSDP